MENIQLRSEYTNGYARKITDQLNKNGVFLNTVEAIEISNKLESYSELMKQMFELEKDVRDLVCCSLKILLDIKSGKSIDEVCDNYGIELPNEKGNNGVFIFKHLHYLNSYLMKVKIHSEEEGSVGGFIRIDAESGKRLPLDKNMNNYYSI